MVLRQMFSRGTIPCHMQPRRVPFLGPIQAGLNMRTVKKGERLSEAEFKAKMQALLKRLQDEKASQAADVRAEPLCLTPAEREARANPPPLLERTGQELREFCSSMPGDEVAENCWIAYNYFEEKKHAAEDGCSLEHAEGQQDGAECRQLDRLEEYARDLNGAASMREFIDLLLFLHRMEEQDAASSLDGGEQAGRGAAVATAGPREMTAAADAAAGTSQRKRLRDLFNQLDTNLDGRLDATEFREGMRRAGDELAGPEVATIFQAMDIHGWLTLDDFLAITEAEEINSHTPLARWLRQHSVESKWWSHRKEGNFGSMDS